MAFANCKIADVISIQWLLICNIISNIIDILKK